MFEQGVYDPGFFGFQLQSHFAYPLSDVLVCFLYDALIFVYNHKVIGVTYNLKRLAHSTPPVVLGPFGSCQDRLECLLGVFF